jgi:hypothetical protein
MDRLIELHAKLSDKAESGNPREAEYARDMLVLLDALLETDAPVSEPETEPVSEPKAIVDAKPEAAVDAKPEAAVDAKPEA